MTSSNTSLPSAAFGQALQFITSAKLQELEKQKLAYEKHTAVLQEANAALDLPTKVEILLKGVRSWSGSGAVNPKSTVIGGRLDLSHLDIWLIQARKDPNFSPDLLKSWAETLETHIQHSLTKFDFAKLFGSLFTEWLSSGDSITAAQTSTEPDAGSNTEFVEVGRQEMHEQMARFKSLVFDPASIDKDGFKAYLASLFRNDASSKALARFRGSIKNFGVELRRRTVTAEDMRWTIESLLSSDLMAVDKRATLREFIHNPTVLEELANVLNMRLGSLESWAWPAQGITVEMRRHLNGKYRALTDPDILDALFLEYLGVKWQVKFKECIKALFASDAWKKPSPPLSRSDLERRKTFLNESSVVKGVDFERQKMRSESFLVGQLASTECVVPKYDETSLEHDGSKPSLDIPAVIVKQKLLHAVATECYLNTAIYKTHTVVRTDLEWFGPSLPHDSILTIFEFFGVSPQWLDFFKVFLRAPLRFSDDLPGEVRVRERGTPFSYALSVICGEVVLFGMDLAVNQRAQGLFLYRIHDDLWFWDAHSKKCVAAWKEINAYASLVGLTINTEKTGSVSVGSELPSELPSGDIRWGFLKFEGAKSRFIIDQGQVDTHITELRRQLSSTKSVLGWINAYNKYMAFFVRNFGGRPAVCFGRPHVDDIVDCLGRIQRALFPGIERGLIQHVQAMIGARFGIQDLPHGYLYLPVANGGLGIRDPMIELLAVHMLVPNEPKSAFMYQLDQDRKNYEVQKMRWETEPRSLSTFYSHTEDFMSFKEYISQREARLAQWQEKYLHLLRVPTPEDIRLAPIVEAALGIIANPPRNYYDRWIFSAYGEEMLEKFGSLEAVLPNLVPIGIVQLYKTAKMKWEQ